MKPIATLAAFAIIGALLGSDLRQHDTTPPESPSPERQVIPLDAEAPSTAKPAQEVEQVWYTSYSAAVLDASSTGRALRVVVAETQPDSDPAPAVGCWMTPADYAAKYPEHPKSFAEYAVPCDVIATKFVREDGTVAPDEFKPFEE